MKEIRNEFENIFPKQYTIVMLHAHADDESLLTAGIINEFMRRGYRLVVVYFAASLIQGEEKTFIRQKELAIAYNVLGAPEVIFLEYCEPKYDKGNPFYLQSLNKVANGVAGIFAERKIDNFILFSYDKNGGYGNKDHLIVHKIGRILLSRYASIFGLVEVTMPRKKYQKWIVEKRDTDISANYLPKLKYWKEDFGLHEDNITHLFTLNDMQVSLKRQALAKHASQMKESEFPLILSENDFKWLLGTEYFIRVNKS